jgi:beta-aspartyl-peptidase (threonine type)
MPIVIKTILNFIKMHMMKKWILWLGFLAGVPCVAGAQVRHDLSSLDTGYVLVLHGGAGTLLRENMSASQEAAYRDGLREALLAGFQRLKEGSSSLDAIQAAITLLEENPLFNAGKGAVFANNGRNELDASVMVGHTGMAGAVAGVTTIKSPIAAARLVMEKSAHVMMVGEGAEIFAKQHGLEMVDNQFFHTEARWNDLQRALAREKQAQQSAQLIPIPLAERMGTVGAVARDHHGVITAGTSTGGMNNKRFGRVGDAPIIGAGTYANEEVGISCTGWGEYFIRQVVAYDVAALMAYKGLPVKQAAEEVIAKVDKAGGNGGLIALDKQGRIAMSFNTSGMYRAAIKSDGQIEIAIFKD